MTPSVPAWVPTASMGRSGAAVHVHSVGGAMCCVLTAGSWRQPMDGAPYRLHPALSPTGRINPRPPGGSRPWTRCPTVSPMPTSAAVRRSRRRQRRPGGGGGLETGCGGGRGIRSRVVMGRQPRNSTRKQLSLPPPRRRDCRQGASAAPWTPFVGLLRSWRAEEGKQEYVTSYRAERREPGEVPVRQVPSLSHGLLTAHGCRHGQVDNRSSRPCWRSQK